MLAQNVASNVNKSSDTHSDYSEYCDQSSRQNYIDRVKSLINLTC